MKQVRIPNLVGAVQVQLTNSFFYASTISIAMQATTLWAVAGPSIQEKLPWVEFWHLALAGVSFVCLLMILDYIFIYPVRQAFLNAQACKHENPAMDLLIRIEKKVDNLAMEMKNNEKSI